MDGKQLAAGLKGEPCPEPEPKEVELEKAEKLIDALDFEASRKPLDDLLNDIPQRSHKP